jgi:RNA polymerase sigma-70 factor (ECF subfamily)
MNRPAAQADASPASNQGFPAGPDLGGDGIDALLPVVYGELHSVAKAVLQKKRAFDPTRTTSLINDVYLRLANRGLRFRNHGHFLCLASKAMRLVLIDRARQRLSAKRGGQVVAQPLNDQIVLSADENEVLAIDVALSRLAALDQLKSRIIELRFFGGLSVDETAEALALSPATIKREWTLARAWLYREVSEND